MLHTKITNGAVEIVLPYPTLPSPLHYNVGFIGNENGPHYLAFSQQSCHQGPFDLPSPELNRFSS